MVISSRHTSARHTSARHITAPIDTPAAGGAISIACTVYRYSVHMSARSGTKTSAPVVYVNEVTGAGRFIPTGERFYVSRLFYHANGAFSICLFSVAVQCGFILFVYDIHPNKCLVVVFFWTPFPHSNRRSLLLTKTPISTLTFTRSFIDPYIGPVYWPIILAIISTRYVSRVH